MTSWTQDGRLSTRQAWRDREGVEWQRRNGSLNLARLLRLLRDGRCTVLHQYIDRVEEIPDIQREALLARMEPYLRGRVDRTDGDHVYFAVVEFKSSDHRSMVVVDEYC
jgi:hypothetical protein